MTTNHGLKEEMRSKRRGSLQREVLQYLAEYGPRKRERLYAGLRDEIPTVEIESVLAELRQLGYVEIGAATDTVLLTASGREWLKGGT
jgi:ribosomal protein S19E (S16A)